MTSRTDELIALARTRPLTPDERAQIDPDATAQPDPLALAEALSGGEQRLSSEEADRIFSGATRAPRRTSRWPLPALGFALAAGIAIIAIVRWPATRTTGIKGGAPQVQVSLAAQRPGADVARALAPPARLAPGEALRIVVTATEPVHLSLFEDERGALRQLWTSGAMPLPAGQSVVGPNAGAGLSLSRGHTGLLVASRARELPAGPGTLEARISLCPDCALERLDVEQQ